MPKLQFILNFLQKAIKHPHCSRAGVSDDNRAAGSQSAPFCYAQLPVNIIGLRLIVYEDISERCYHIKFTGGVKCNGVAGRITVDEKE